MIVTNWHEFVQAAQQYGTSALRNLPLYGSNLFHKGVVYEHGIGEVKYHLTCSGSGHLSFEANDISEVAGRRELQEN